MNRAIFFVAALIAGSAFSYRYVCNGLLANGDQRTDACGECNQQKAARWANPEVTVSISSTSLPAHVLEQDWRDIVEKSFSVWNSIPGSSFRFILSDNEAKRNFGDNTDATHEIMWITSKEEWRSLIGVGEFGTLGATIPRYHCDPDRGRTIFDADMALNGLSHINWQVHCDDDDFDCVQIQTTLVHELGHFLGLDHPCLGCQTSVMSARAVYNITKTMPDDEDGVRSLYLLAAPRDFGSACEDESDCDSKYACYEVSDNPFCTLECNVDSDCPKDTRCVGRRHEKYCAFREKGEKGWEEESCADKGCEQPLICAGRSKETSHCYATCSFFGDCLNDKSCVHFKDDLSICMNVRDRGQECGESDICDTDLTCIFDDADYGKCRELCDANNRCEEGVDCVRSKSGEYYCAEKDQGLNLDEASSPFRNNRKSQRSKAKASKAGCQQSSADTLLLVGFLGYLVRKRKIHQ